MRIFPISSFPTAPTAVTLHPSFAKSTDVPAAVPAAVIRISSMSEIPCPGGISETCRPNTSRMWTPIETISVMNASLGFHCEL